MESFAEYISLGRGGGTSFLAAMLDVFKKIFAVRYDDGVQVMRVRTEEEKICVYRAFHRITPFGSKGISIA